MLSVPEKFSDRLTVSISELASMLGVQVKTLYNQISAGSCPIPTIKLGGRRMVRIADLRRLTGNHYPLKTPVGRRSKSIKRI